MDKLDINTILNRKKTEHEIIDIINNFYYNSTSLTRAGIYICGPAGCGKTNFVINLLKNNNFDIVYYDNSIIRNKQLIENITYNNLSNNNIVSLFNKKNKKIVIVLDEIDGINFGDKMSLNFLIKKLSDILSPKLMPSISSKTITIFLFFLLNKLTMLLLDKLLYVIFSINCLFLIILLS